jgi:hypothetical protein
VLHTVVIQIVSTPVLNSMLGVDVAMRPWWVYGQQADATSLPHCWPAVLQYGPTSGPLHCSQDIHHPVSHTVCNFQALLRCLLPGVAHSTRPGPVVCAQDDVLKVGAKYAGLYYAIAPLTLAAYAAMLYSFARMAHGLARNLRRLALASVLTQVRCHRWLFVTWVVCCHPLNVNTRHSHACLEWNMKVSGEPVPVSIEWAIHLLWTWLDCQGWTGSEEPCSSMLL